MMKNKITERLNIKEMDSQIHDELNILDEANLKIRKCKSKLKTWKKNRDRKN